MLVTMLEATGSAFEDGPVGRWTSVGTGLVWCDSPSFCGAHVWGRPSPDQTRTILRIFTLYERALAQTFDVILDARAVESVDGESLALLVSWLRDRRAELVRRVRMQAGVIADGPNGYLLAGLLPAIGDSHPFRIYPDATSAFRAIAGERGEKLAKEIDDIAERVRGEPHELRVLRATLAAQGDVGIEAIARALATSPRSLQRSLASHGTSYKEEVLRARFELACTLLATTDGKLANICARLGISERALTLLFRERTGLTPAEWRKTQKS